MSQSTDLSMGCIMKGMQPSPTAVTVHLRATGGSLVVFSNTLLLIQHILLIVNPGIATDANPCQTRVSVTISEVFLALYSASDSGKL